MISDTTAHYIPHAEARWRAWRRIATSYLALKYHLFAWRVRVRTRFRHYDFCHAVDILSLGAAAALARRGVPVLYDANEIPDPFERQGRHFVAADPAVKEHLARAVAHDLPQARCIIAVSGAMADFVAQRFGRAATAIPNMRAPLDRPASDAIRRDVGAGPGTRIIVYPCTAAPHLGVETAIEALARLPGHFRLVFVGRFVTQAYRAETERLIRFLGLADRVLLKGELPDADYLRYIAGADLGLVPLGFDFRNQHLVLPWRVADLAAAQVPMVATPSEEILRLGRDVDLGEIAKGTDAASIADAISALANTPPARIAAIKRDLRRLAETYSPGRRDVAYRATLASLGVTGPGRAAFLFNVAMRDNRRAIGFIDALCDAGWRVDLYVVSGPDPALFQHPARVRIIKVRDRLASLAWLAKVGEWAARISTQWPPLAAIGDALVGTRFGLKQIFRTRRYASLVAAAVKTRPFDIVIATDIFACAAGARFATPFRVFDATEIPDLKQRSARFLRRIPRWLGLVLRRDEWCFVHGAGLVFAPSQALTAYLRRRYRHLPSASIRAIRNAAPTIETDETDSLRRCLGIPAGDTMIISPCGISRETGALAAIRALRLLPPDHVLVFIGRFSDPAFAAEAKRVAAVERQAHRVFFTGPFEPARYRAYLAEADLGLVLFDPAIGNLRLAAPNRFFDLVAAEVPVVTTRIADVAAMVERTGGGIVVESLRPAAIAAIAAAIAALHDHRGDPSLDAALARLARFHTWEKERAHLIELLVARSGPLEGRRVALLTLRNAGSNRRFRLIGEALAGAGAEVHGFDTRIGASAAPLARPRWLTTLDVT